MQDALEWRGIVENSVRKMENRNDAWNKEAARAARTVRQTAEPRSVHKTAQQERRERQLRAEHRARRRRARRRRQLLFLLGQGILWTAILGCMWQLFLHREQFKTVLGEEVRFVRHIAQEKGADGKNTWGSDGLQMGDYAKTVGLETVNAPVKRTEEEVLLRLSELAEEKEEIRTILENKEAYPLNMLEALANNPEMSGFVMGYLTADKSASGGLTEEEKGQKHPLLLQWDPRWGYVSYGDESNVGLAGCGPTCLSMALYMLLGDASLTPDKIAAYGMENGYYMAGTGTLWALIEDVPQQYGITVSNPGVEEGLMRQALDDGKVLICAMRPGDFTSGGHFIVIYGYDANGFLVNDPNCVARSQKSWSYDVLNGQIKQLWALEN